MRSAPEPLFARAPRWLRIGGLVLTWAAVLAVGCAVLLLIQPLLSKYIDQLPAVVAYRLTAASVCAVSGPVFLLTAIRGPRIWRFWMYGLALFASTASAAMTADGILVLLGPAK